MVKRNTVKSSILKAGRRTYFFDVYKASNDKHYLRITESQMPVKEGEERKRNTFILFPEQIQDFQSRISELSGVLMQTA